MIKGYCRTNIDDFRQVNWPEEFTFPPRVGDYVEGTRTGPGPGSKPRLKVVTVTHVMVRECKGADTYKTEPRIEVELHR